MLAPSSFRRPAATSQQAYGRSPGSRPPHTDSGGRSCVRANLCLRSGYVRSAPATISKIVPCMLRIMGNYARRWRLWRPPWLPRQQRQLPYHLGFYRWCPHGRVSGCAASSQRRSASRCRAAARAAGTRSGRAAGHRCSQAAGNGYLPPLAAGEPVERGHERAEQHGRHAALRNAMGNRKPGLPERRPSDRPPAAESTGRIQQPVNVERDAPARQYPRQWRKDRRLPRPGSPGNDKQRLDRRVVVTVPALRASSGAPAGLHHHLCRA